MEESIPQGILSEMNRDLQETYDRIAEDWHRDHERDDWWVAGTDAFAKLMPAGGSILDVGCGSGMKARYLAKLGFAMTGIDISQGLLDIARREAPTGRFMLLPMEELDTLPDTFDGVFAQASLLHIPKQEAGVVVQKMANRLKRGGYLYLAVKELRAGHAPEEVLRENDYGYEYERFFSYYTMTELKRYLVESGLSVVEEIPYPHPNGKTVWLQIIGQRC
jgi:SAM-dependent methyltransferase